MVFVVEDNRIAISTDTTRTKTIALGILNESEWQRVDGSDVEAVASAGREAITAARSGQGPQFIWCDVERFSNHSSADDQRMYRPAEELELMQERDPVVLFQRHLVESGWMTSEEAEVLEEVVREEVRGDLPRRVAC